MLVTRAEITMRRIWTALRELTATTKTMLMLPLTPRTFPRAQRASASFGPEVRISTSSSLVKSTDGVTSPSW